jgi:hypothetical protein
MIASCDISSTDELQRQFNDSVPSIERWGAPLLDGTPTRLFLNKAPSRFGRVTQDSAESISMIACDTQQAEGCGALESTNT